MAGEVRLGSDRSVRATRSGVVVDSEGRVHGGPFVAGSNPIRMTFEVTLEEWLPQAPDARAG